MTLGYDDRYDNGYNHGYQDAENRYKAYIQHYVDGLKGELGKYQDQHHKVIMANIDTYAKMGIADTLIGRIASLKFAIELAEERML